MPADRLQLSRKPAGHALETVVPVGGPNHRADKDGFIGQACELLKNLANFNPRNVGLDRTEFAANLFRRVRLEIPQILVWRPAAGKDIDDCLVRAAGWSLGGFGP